MEIMKKLNLVLTLTLSTFTFLLFSQEKSPVKNEVKIKSISKDQKSPVIEKDLRKEQKSKTYSIKAGEQQVLHDKNYYQQRVKTINNQIEAIEIKMEHIQSNPSEKEKAIQSGWFDEMKNTIQLLKEEKEEIVTKYLK